MLLNIYFSRNIPVLMFLLFLFSPAVHSQESQNSSTISDGLEAFEEGDFEEDNFEEEEFEETSETKIEHEEDLSEEKTIWLDWIRKARFTYRHELAYRTEKPEKTVVNRSSIRMEAEQLLSDHYYFKIDGKLSYNAVYNSDEYSDKIKRDYIYQRPLRELYLQANFGKTGYKVGKQIVVWGKADGGVITDVISPRDQTELIYTPLEDARIGQVMLNIDHYTEDGSQWSFIFIPDPRTNITAPEGHEYSITSGPRSVGPRSVESNETNILSEEKPERSFFNAEIGVRWAKTSGQSDYALMAASLVQDAPAFVTKGFNALGQLELQPTYQRYSMVGAGLNIGNGNFLWKGEIALHANKTFNTTTPLKDDGIVNKNVIGSALGFDYDAAGAYQLTVEVTNEHIVDWQETISQTRQDEGVLFTSWSKSFWNETLKPQYTVIYQLQDYETLHRPQVIYEFNDQLSVQFEWSYFDTRKEGSSLAFLSQHQRVSTAVKYYF